MFITNYLTRIFKEYFYENNVSRMNSICVFKDGLNI